MKVSTIVNRITMNHPKLLRRLLVISSQKNETVEETIISCLKGDITLSGLYENTAKKHTSFCLKGDTTHGCGKGAR